MSDTKRFEKFVVELTRQVDEHGESEAAMVPCTSTLLAETVATDDWLPDFCAVPDPDTYRQYLLHCDPLERFSIVSFVWGPGQKTPVHDHTTWGVLGLLRGGEFDTPFSVGESEMIAGETAELKPGDIGVVSPTVGDIHQVANRYDDRTSVSIHVYGGNIGRIDRHAYDPETGTIKDFVSAYNNDTVPNFWNR